uniref:Uncharacterized protein n=1 Tax=Nelumbo nucifera TaxID=4432 RepID=A0A822ZEW1_NELNU|nr:TPA_asm: hypothetical protein HUJ06_001657 [Nelumbo nucifera]
MVHVNTNRSGTKGSHFFDSVFLSFFHRTLSIHQTLPPSAAIEFRRFIDGEKNTSGGDVFFFSSTLHSSTSTSNSGGRAGDHFSSPLLLCPL